MVNKFDYNNESVMEILNNANYTEDQKKELFEKYKSDLKELRRKEIIDRLNEYAKNNPVITQEEYVAVLKRYSEDDLSKPFEVIESELNAFKNDMDKKYNDYLVKKQEEEAALASKPEVSETPAEVDEEIKPDVTPFANAEKPVVEETPVVPAAPETEENNLEPTVFEDKEVKEVMPEELPEASSQKGNASAIIISIIAIIIGIVIMYAIIKLR